MLRSLGISGELLKDCLAHSHQSWEIVLNLKGEGNAYVEGEAYPFVPGTIMCIPPNLQHYKRSDEGFQDIYFHTDQFPAASQKPLLLEDDLEKSFETLLRMMIRFYYEMGDPSRELVTSLHNAALQLLNRRLFLQKEDPVIRQIKNTLVDSMSDPEVNISDILAASGYSADHIRRRFLQETGMTPVEYLTNLRVEYAKQLLDQKAVLQLSVSEIAAMCGYYDLHYFSRVFKKSTGFSPRSYLAEQKRLAEENLWDPPYDAT